MFAIVRTGGKQYRVGVGDQITVERIVGDVGAEIELADVLAIGGVREHATLLFIHAGDFTHDHRRVFLPPQNCADWRTDLRGR